MTVVRRRSRHSSKHHPQQMLVLSRHTGTKVHVQTSVLLFGTVAAVSQFPDSGETVKSVRIRFGKQSGRLRLDPSFC